MTIVHDSVPFSPPFYLLPAPPVRLALPAPRIAGLLGDGLPVSIAAMTTQVHHRPLQKLSKIEVFMEQHGFRSKEEIDAELAEQAYQARERLIRLEEELMRRLREKHHQ